MDVNNKYLNNIIWLIFDKFFILFGSLFVTIIVSKHLGPDGVGLISYSIALGGLALTISQWGGSYIIYNIGISKYKLAINLIISTENIRAYIYICVWLILCLWVFISNGLQITSLLISLFMLSSIFLGLDLYQYYYNARLESKYNARTSMLAKLISMIFRWGLVYINSNIWFFIIPFFLESYIIYFLRKRRLYNDYKKFRKIKKSYSKLYLSMGKSIVLSSVLVFFYSKINEIMIVKILSYQDLGYYSIALTLSSAWTFIPLSVGISLMTKPLSLKYNLENKLLYAFPFLVMIIISLPILCIVFFSSNAIVDLTFGSTYIESSTLLFILSVSTLFSSLGFISNRLLTSIEGGGKYLFKKSIVSSVFSIVLSYVLISYYGLIGAAYSFLIIELLNLTLFNYFFENKFILKVHISLLSSVFIFRNFIND